MSANPLDDLGLSEENCRVALERLVIIDREDDGSWRAELLPLPSCMAAGATEREARAACVDFALEIMIDRLRVGSPY